MTGLALLLQRGIRPTKVRLALLEQLAAAQSPKTTQELLSMFQSPIHKVTLYRDLRVLVMAGIAEEHRFKERSVRYRLAGQKHTHNLVCENCGQIDEVELPNDLDQQEKLIARKKRFVVSNHTLEFYGRCALCQ